jgi:hypothetical protein
MSLAVLVVFAGLLTVPEPDEGPAGELALIGEPA